MIKKYRVLAQAIFACAILFVSCFAGNKNVITRNAIKVHLKVDFIDSAFKVLSISDSFDIVYYQNYTIYIAQLPIDYMRATTIPNGHIAFQDVVKTDIDSLYIMFRDGDTAGLRFSFRKGFEPSKILKSEYFRYMNVAQGMKAFVENSERFVRSEVHDDTLVEVSVPTVSDASFSDTAFFYMVDEVNDRPYTFSAALEQLRGKKLVKVLTRWKPYYDSSLQHLIPGREFVFRRVDYVISDSMAKRAVEYFLSHEGLLRRTE